MMPDGASEDRADQLATLGVIGHEHDGRRPTWPSCWRAPRRASAGLDPWRAANLREMRHAWIHENALPSDLVEARTRASSACEMAWREARKNADFKALLPTLAEVRDHHARVGEAKAAALGLSLYDALLDEYEPGGRCGAHRRAVRRARGLPAGDAAAGDGAPAKRPASRCRSTGRSRSRRSAQLGDEMVAARWASTSTTAGSTSRRIPSPAARPTTCASPRATTRPTSRAP